MKIIKQIINVLTTLIIIIGVLFVGLYLCGIIPYVVLSGSMEPTIQTGSLCFINKHAKYESVEEKDIIAFRLSDGTLVTHRVVSIDEDQFVTKGDNNQNQDGVSSRNNYVGKNTFWIPYAGYAIMLIQTTKGKIIFGTCVVLLFVAGLLFGENSKKEKKEKEQEE